LLGSRQFKARILSRPRNRERTKEEWGMKVRSRLDMKLLLVAALFGATAERLEAG
jgi:hypothetical protein